MTRYAKVHQIALYVCFGLGCGLSLVLVLRGGWQVLFSPALVVVGLFGGLYGGALYLVLGMWLARWIAGKKPAAQAVVVHPSFDPRVPIRTAQPPIPPPMQSRGTGLPDGVVGIIRTEKVMLADGRVIERVEGTRVVEAQEKQP